MTKRVECHLVQAAREGCLCLVDKVGPLAANCPLSSSFVEARTAGSWSHPHIRESFVAAGNKDTERDCVRLPSFLFSEFGE